MSVGWFHVVDGLFLGRQVRVGGIAGGLGRFVHRVQYWVLLVWCFVRLVWVCFCHDPQTHAMKFHGVYVH